MIRLRNVKVHLFWKIYLSTLLCLVVYSESLIHIFHSLQWAQIECHTDNCLKVLLVADPQILGNTFDTKLYWPLANYDSDRHLGITYRRALQHSMPHVICFLGDLMDEGSVATVDQYEEYFRRFANIFPQPTAHTTMIYIPGDNDIGGEGFEPVKDANVERFRQYFNERSSWMIPNGMQIYNVNRINRAVVRNENLEYENQNLFVFFISHMSLLKYADVYSVNAIKQYQPDVIFSAHDHTSKYAITTKNTLGVEPIFSPLNVNQATRHDIVSFNLNEFRKNGQLLEISVPTCSYRMGVMKIGYGFAVLDGETLSYTVLWTPQRFYQLAFYSLLIIPLKLLCGQIWCNLFKRYWCCCRSRSRNYLPLHVG
ncbi:uncharacterized protein LOC129726757 [Wyeomyia smithii]|uniref:uncharacterized protein LOC129726757 n=1 Tax=Wyeomyia smithii TaxID=174621 RepID=UPI0024680C42|nr:uncharacterized protein LOC129726757 [Wyeomyia smithii]